MKRQLRLSMSIDDPEVKLAKDTGYRTQWAKGLFYRKEGDKFVFKSEKARYLVIGLFLFTTIAVLFQESPTAEPADSSTLSTPQNLPIADSPLQLDKYEIEDEQKSVKTKSKRRKIEPLKIVSRTDLLGIPLGSTVRAVLKTGATNGPVKAVLLEDLNAKGEVLLAEGTILWGIGNSTESRLLVSFTKYVDEDGVSKPIVASAYDSSDQILGLKGAVIGRTAKKIAAAAGLGVAGALQTMQTTQAVGSVAVVKPSLENALLNGASGAALGLAEQELEELKNRQSIIEVSKGTKLIVVFGEK